MKKRKAKGVSTLDQSSHINVPDHLLPLAFGTKGCSAADVPKVPKAWELGGSARWPYFFVTRICPVYQHSLTLLKASDGRPSIV